VTNLLKNHSEDVLSAAPLTYWRRMICGTRVRLPMAPRLAIRAATRPTSAQRFTQAES